MYQGHLSDGSSVQKHSAGPLYPYVLGVKEYQFEPGVFTRTWVAIGPAGEFQAPTQEEVIAFIQQKKCEADSRRRLALATSHNNQQWALFQKQRNAR